MPSSEIGREKRPPLKVEIDLGAMWIDDGENGGQALSERLEELVAARLVTLVDQRAKQRLDDLVDDVRQSVVEDEVKSIVTVALSKEVQPTDTFGRPKGEPTTLEELVVDRAERYLEQLTGWEPESNRSHRHSTPAIWAKLDQAVDRAFSGKLKAAVKQAEDAAIAKVEAEAAKIIGQAVKRAAL